MEMASRLWHRPVINYYISYIISYKLYIIRAEHSVGLDGRHHQFWGISYSSGSRSESDDNDAAHYNTGVGDNWCDDLAFARDCHGVSFPPPTIIIRFHCVWCIDLILFSAKCCFVAPFIDFDDQFWLRFW